MLAVGVQSNVVAQQHFTQHASYAATYAGLHVYRNAALLELADRYVGELDDGIAVKLHLPTSVRRVLISAESQRHAIARRAISSQIDADLVAQRIADAFANIQYMLLPQPDPMVYALIGHSRQADRWLKIPLKLVPAERPRRESDELWVRTAHPFGKRKMRKALAKGLLIDLRGTNAF